MPSGLDKPTAYKPKEQMSQTRHRQRCNIILFRVHGPQHFRCLRNAANLGSAFRLCFAGQHMRLPQRHCKQNRPDFTDSPSIIVAYLLLSSGHRISVDYAQIALAHPPTSVGFRLFRRAVRNKRKKESETAPEGSQLANHATTDSEIICAPAIITGGWQNPSFTI